MRNNILTLVLALTSIALAAFALSRSSETAPETQSDPAEVSAHAEHEEDEHILLNSMGYFQRFSTKLWWAGKNQNWPLAQFYVHELEEIMEGLEASDIIEEGASISELIGEIALPPLEGVEESIKAEDAAQFEHQYQLLINACNACHARTKMGFVQIIVPEGQIPYNQVF